MLGFINIKLYQLMYLIQEQKISLVSKMNQKQSITAAQCAGQKFCLHYSQKLLYTFGKRRYGGS